MIPKPYLTYYLAGGQYDGEGVPSVDYRRLDAVLEVRVDPTGDVQVTGPRRRADGTRAHTNATLSVDVTEPLPPWLAILVLDGYRRLGIDRRVDILRLDWTVA